MSKMRLHVRRLAGPQPYGLTTGCARGLRPRAEALKDFNAENPDKLEDPGEAILVEDGEAGDAAGGWGGGALAGAGAGAGAAAAAAGSGGGAGAGAGAAVCLVSVTVFFALFSIAGHSDRLERWQHFHYALSPKRTNPSKAQSLTLLLCSISRGVWRYQLFRR